MTSRARAIVRQASTLVKNKTAKSWLFNDEFGNWEKQANEWIEKAQVKLAHKSEEAQNKEIAQVLAFLAVEATLQSATKKGR